MRVENIDKAVALKKEMDKLNERLNILKQVHEKFDYYGVPETNDIRLTMFCDDPSGIFGTQIYTDKDLFKHIIWATINLFEEKIAAIKEEISTL